MKLFDLLFETEITCPEELKCTEITGIQYDSRKTEKGDLFVCLKGWRTDGHTHAEAAARKGASAIVSQEPLNVTESPVLLSKDTRKALSIMSRNFYGDSSRQAVVFGVTGTNGKTTTTAMIQWILQSRGRQCARIGTLGAEIGGENTDFGRTTPESSELQKAFRQMRQAGIDHCVMEASSHGLALGRVSHISFDYAVFTNLTLDHLDFHGTEEEYYQAKKKLFLMAEKASCVNEDDPFGKRLAGEIKGIKPSVFSYSLKNKKADFYGRIRRSDERGSNVEIYRDGCLLGELVLKTPGLFNVYNSLAAASVCLAYGIGFDQVEEGLATLPAVSGRFELVENPMDMTVIVDFAHTPDALQMVLTTANQFKKGRLICVFGCGGDRDRTKRSIMGKLAGSLADYCIITSDNPRTERQEDIAAEIEGGMKETTCPYEIQNSRKLAIERAVEIYEAGDVILIAGKGHETYQIIGVSKTHFDDREAAKEAIEKKMRQQE